LGEVAEFSVVDCMIVGCSVLFPQTDLHENTLVYCSMNLISEIDVGHTEFLKRKKKFITVKQENERSALMWTLVKH
jgi:hypothetical protein